MVILIRGDTVTLDEHDDSHEIQAHVEWGPA